MRFSTAILTALALAIPAISAPNPARVIQKVDGPTTGKYIVKLKDNVSHDSVLGRINGSPTHSWTVINGFAGEFSPEALDIMLNHPDVEYISEDSIGSIATIQTDAPWGLSRLSSNDKLANQNPFALNFVYNYTATGRGVDIYVIDTGIRTSHTQFNGRAKWGKTFGGYPDVDDHGHGTHCAGTVAGSRWGVAKEARVIAVKVFNRDGQGSSADAISGVNFVAQQARLSGRPSVTSMSFGFPPTRALDDAVVSLINGGVHAVVAAGNDDDDAAGSSPARVRNAITVAASTIADDKADFSNFGSVVDIFAPGEEIMSAGIASDTATKFDSGTSMAAPHVSGLIAYLISRDGNSSPIAMADKLKKTGLSGKLSGVPRGTINLLAHIG